MLPCSPTPPSVNTNITTDKQRIHTDMMTVTLTTAGFIYLMKAHRVKKIHLEQLICKLFNLFLFEH